MDPDQIDRLAYLASACATPLRARVVAALSAQGVNQAVTLADLALILADDTDGPPAAGPLHKEVDMLAKIGLVQMDRAGKEPSNVSCAIKEDGALAELSDLALRAQETLAR